MVKHIPALWRQGNVHSVLRGIALVNVHQAAVGGGGHIVGVGIYVIADRPVDDAVIVACTVERIGALGRAFIGACIVARHNMGGELIIRY